MRTTERKAKDRQRAYDPLYVARLFALIFTVAVGVYFTVLIANMGGYVDEIRRGQIRETIVLAASLDPEFRQLPESERTALLSNALPMKKHATVWIGHSSYVVSAISPMP